MDRQQQSRQAPPPPDAAAVDGFVLYNMNIVDDSVGSEQHSAPSMLSPLSGFSSGASSSVLVRNGPGPRLPPPPQTGTLRTNFTTGGGNPHSGNQPHPAMASQRRPGEARNDFTVSPDAGFRDLNTPTGNLNPAEGEESVRPFLDIMALQEKIDKPTWISMTAVFAAIVFGLIIGSILQHYSVSTTVAQWLMTPGNLYLRAVQCVVIPFVFVNMVVSTADLVYMRLGSRISVRVLLLFSLVTLLALAQGMGMGFLLRELFNKNGYTLTDASTEAVFGIQCANSYYMEMQSNGTVTCSAASVDTAAEFIVDDINSALIKNSDTSDSTLTDNLIAIIETIVPTNIMAAFVDVTLLSVVAFALPMGVTLAKSFHGPIHMNPLLEFLREVNETLVHMIQWVVKFTPYAVLSLMIGSFGVNLEDTTMPNPLHFMYKLAGTFAVGVLAHMLVVMPLLFFLFTGTSPFRFMKHLIPAYVSALGNSSSMATLPMTLRCIEESRSVSNSVMYFVMSIGSNLNMAGTAMYLPFAVYVMIDVVGLSSGLDTGDIFILLTGALLGTLSAAPIPSGAFTVVTTVWGIVLPKYSIPSVVSALLLAADVMLDRLVTVCNVNSAAMTCRIIGDQLDESLTDELMRAQHVRRQQPFSISEM
jgi:solute carrier family 1 (neutral amino acid transporter) protein 5